MAQKSRFDSGVQPRRRNRAFSAAVRFPKKGGIPLISTGLAISFGLFALSLILKQCKTTDSSYLLNIPLTYPPLKINVRF